jgi:predicted transport protein
LHTIGNLTLTGYNSEYSDRPFIVKRDMIGGFRESTLRVNSGLGHEPTWNEGAIKQRAARLSNLALDVWTYPRLKQEQLEKYRRTEPRTARYTIADHPYLLGDALKKLFEVFRRDVRALDECVSEEFLKYYVAYKAETNFVDVYPQAKRLRLILNLPFPQVSDPLRICTNVAGYQLNGEVRVYLASEQEMPYVLGLVTQAFEYQIGVAG